ncbi:response regulator [Vibrio sp. Isolate25]|uniref:HD domain-containing phosphohydrolase n=1 Tax=unclassified Vibrio TaxID=2614977 RepID=UPI001EFC9D24|nr:MULTISPECIES: HD domain-containing phosphohydrolase [unclassified Vibrio]MCG9596141.1 response regulator [Vibrio sp. Isolate25]MCG9676826.1 response regulator [Vibrio sp. Isolate24]
MDKESLVKLVIVDDEVQITRALSRLLRKDFCVVAFNNPVDALAYLNDHEVSLIVADLNMVSMNGPKFFSQAKHVQPSAVRVALASRVVNNDFMALINEGSISYVLSKPWENEAVKKTLSRLKSQFEMMGGIEKYVKHQEVVNTKLQRDNESLKRQLAEKSQYINGLELKSKGVNHKYNELMHSTLNVLVNVIVDSGYLQKPDLLRIANHAKELVSYMSSSDVSSDQAYRAALLHPIGLVFCQLNQQSSPVYEAHHIGPCSFGPKAAELFSSNAFFEPLLSGIQYQDENVDGSGFAKGLIGEQIPVLARLIRVVKDYHYLTVNHGDRTKLCLPAVAESVMKEKSKIHYDPVILKAYFHMLEDKRRNNSRTLECCVSLSDLKPGIEIKRDVSLPNGNILIKRGSTLNQEMLDRLFELEESKVQHFVYVI